MAQLDARTTGDQVLRVRPPPGRQHSFVKFDHEIFSMVILSLLLIQEGQLSVSGERMCTILVNLLEDLACLVKSVVRKTDLARHDSTGLTGL